MPAGIFWIRDIEPLRLAVMPKPRGGDEFNPRDSHRQTPSPAWLPPQSGRNGYAVLDLYFLFA